VTSAVLAIDTSTSSSSAAVLVDGAVTERWAAQAEGARPSHSTDVLLLVRDSLAGAGVDHSEIGRIVVGLGPGTFTGIRIGLSIAQGLAISTGADLVGVGSLRALLAEADSTLPTVAMIDARRGEIFILGANGGYESPRPVAVSLDAVPSVLAPGSLCIGEGALLIADRLREAGMEVPRANDPRHRVSAGRLALLGDLPDRSGDQVLPDYVRDPDAVPTSER